MQFLIAQKIDYIKIDLSHLHTIPMVRTYGLTHIALEVKNVERSFRFYQQVLGVYATYKGEGFIQFETPGCHDVVVLEENKKPLTKTGGIKHFGFRLVDPAEIEAAAEAILQAGGSIIDKGEFCRGTIS